MTTATAAVAAPSKQGHPKGLYLLFFTEAFERFQYYGMRAFLVLYLVDATKGLGWSRSDALSLYGTYTGLVYLTPVLGGYIADRFFGQRLSVVLGGTLMMVGQFFCALKSVPTLYVGLVVLVLGNGFFKANISTMVGQLYAPGDRRRDNAFTIFYMGINLGGFLGPLIAGSLAEKIDWSLGFTASGVGMAIGVLTFLALKGKLLVGIGMLKEKPSAREVKRFLSGLAIAAGLLAGLAWLAVKGPLAGRVNWDVVLLVAILGTMLGFFLYLTFFGKLGKDERDRVIVIFVLVAFVVFFWAAFEQAGGLMNLYTDTKVDRTVFGFTLPTTWFQSANSAFIVLFAPLFAMLWTWLAGYGKEPHTPTKMALGLLLISCGFVLMYGAAKQSAAEGKAAFVWVLGAYLFHTWGELALSPVGLSMVTKLAPTRFASALMGVWFLSNAAANKLAGMLGGAAEKVGDQTMFGIIVIGTAGAGLVLLTLSAKLQRMMHGAEDVTQAPSPPGSTGKPVMVS
jgi:proton-dependent oligopeptide transporter, POT family